MDLNTDVKSLLEVDAENNITEASARKLNLRRKRLRSVIYAWIRKAKFHRKLPTMDELLSVSDQLFDVDRLLVEVDSVDELSRCTDWDGKLQFLRDAIEKGYIPVELTPAAAVKPIRLAVVQATPEASQTILLPPQVQAFSLVSQTASLKDPNEMNTFRSKEDLKAQQKHWVSYKGNHLYQCELCKVDFKEPPRHLTSKRHFKNVKAIETGINPTARKFLKKYPFLKLQGDKFFCTMCGIHLCSSSNFSAPRHLNSETHKNGEKAKETHLQWLENVSRDEVTTEFRNFFAARGIPLNVFKNQAFMEFLTKVTGRVLFTEAAMRLKEAKSGDSSDNSTSAPTKKRSRSKAQQNGKGPKRSKKPKLEIEVEVEVQPPEESLPILLKGEVLD